MSKKNRAFTLNLFVFLLLLFPFVLVSCTPTGVEEPASTTAPEVEATEAPASPTEEDAAPTEEEMMEEPALTEDRLVPEIIFPFSSAAHDPIRNESGLLLTNEWEKLGMTVSPQPLDYAGYNAILETHEGYHAYVAGFVSRPERLDPDVLLYRPFQSTASSNYSNYNNPVYDALVEEQRTEMDIAQRKELVFEAQEMLAEELPSIALYHVSEIHLYNSRLFQNPVSMVGQGLYNVWNLLDIEPVTDERVLKMGEVESIDTPNPFGETTGANVETLRLVYDLLARIGPDGDPVPWAAESWEVIDTTTIQVNLRTDMTFHDGEPVTADDVKFSYDIQKEEGSSIYIPFLDPISEVEKIDDYTLIFHLADPYPPLYQATFAQIFILPQHIWEDIPSPRAEYPNEQPIGSGPFRFGEWIVGEEIRLPAFKEHFHAPQVDALIQVNYSNPDALFLGLINEEIHMHDRRLLPAAIEQAEGIDHLTRVDLPDFGIYYVGFNTAVPPFDSLLFRQAIAHTIDWDTIVNVILSGYGEKGKGFIAPANKFWHNPDLSFPEYDPEKARQMLADAGYEWDEEGRLYLPAGE